MVFGTQVYQFFLGNPLYRDLIALEHFAEFARKLAFEIVTYPDFIDFFAGMERFHNGSDAENHFVASPRGTFSDVEPTIHSILRISGDGRCL